MKYVILDDRLKEFEFKPTRKGDAGIDLRAAVSHPVTIMR